MWRGTGQTDYFKTFFKQYFSWLHRSGLHRSGLHRSGLHRSGLHRCLIVCLQWILFCGGFFGVSVRAATDSARATTHHSGRILLPRAGIVTTSLSTLGAGLGVQGIWGPYLGLSAAVMGLPLNIRPSIEGIRFLTKIRYISGQFTASYYPWRYAHSNVHLDVGLLVNGNHASLDPDIASGQTFKFEGYDFQLPADARFTTKIKFNQMNPYIGLGWGTTKAKGFGFQMHAGVIYQGKPQLSYDVANIKLADAPGATQEQIDQAVAAATAKMTADVHKHLDWLAWYPIVSFALSYSF